MPGAVHIPIRQCRICRMRAPKAELNRWVQGVEGWQPDKDQAAQGRGAYTCSEDCTQKLLSGKRK